MTTKKARPDEGDDFKIDVVRGQRSGKGGTPSQTRLNLIQGARYINVYPSVESMVVIDGWGGGVSLQWAGKGGTPETMRLRPAEGQGFTVRKKPHQRSHICVPTSHLNSVRWKTTLYDHP
jgi:hypothetical protein